MTQPSVDPRMIIRRRQGTFENYTIADGRDARRYWVHDRILVGGEIRSRQDGDHLVADAHVTHCLSLQDECSDEGKLPPGLSQMHKPHPDTQGKGFPTAMLHEILDWAHTALKSSEDAILHVHCQLGHRRGPSIAWMLLRSVFGQSADQALQQVQRGRTDFMAPMVRVMKRNIWVPRGQWQLPTEYLSSIDDALRLYMARP
jgi:protein-tyrosine phosphatase